MNLSYKECIDIVNNIEEKDKIQFFILKIKSCPSCDTWFKHQSKEVFEYSKDFFDTYILNCDEEDMPFPPPSSPTLYFYHKNFKGPFIRQGMLPSLEMKKELQKFVRIMKGESYESVFR